MKRDAIDFHEIRPQHLAVHERLLNWSRYVGSHRGSQPSPMFRNYRSSEVWQSTASAIPIDTLDGSAMEKAVFHLPEKHCAAVRWYYVYSARGCNIHRMCRLLAVRQDTLNELVHDGRSMLVNRRS